MKILIVSTSYPSQSEGEAAAGVFVQDFASALALLGIRVHVVAPARHDSDGLEDLVWVTRFSVPRLPMSLLNPKYPSSWPAIWRSLHAGHRAVMQACEMCRPDHILALWALPSGAWAQSAARRWSIPFTTWSLGSDIWSLSRIPLVRWWLINVLRGASARFADGHQLSADVTKLAGLDCQFLPSSRVFSSRKRLQWRSVPPYRLAYLGRWHPNKGVDLLLEALGELADENWQLIDSVRIFGGGPLEVQVRQAVTKLARLGRPVTVGGYLERVEALALFEWADYVLLPSRIESIPVVFSDAMSAGCPVISSPVGDLPQLIKTFQCGVLAESLDSKAIAAAIAKSVLTSPARFADGIRKAASSFDVGVAARSFATSLGWRPD